MLDADAILRSEAEVLRLESSSGGGSLPRPKKRSNIFPWRPRIRTYQCQSVLLYARSVCSTLDNEP